MHSMYYIGLDVHNRVISYCVKDGGGTIHGEGKIPATRVDLDRWMKTLPQPWTAAMEASYGQPHQLRQQMEVWFYFRIETTAERPTRRAEGRKEFTPALLPKRVRRAFALLTKTYHGSRVIGKVNFAG